MSWPIKGEVSRKTESGREEFPSKCQVGLVDGTWWMNVVFDKDVTIKAGEELQIAFKLDKP